MPTQTLKQFNYRSGKKMERSGSSPLPFEDKRGSQIDHKHKKKVSLLPSRLAHVLNKQRKQCAADDTAFPLFALLPQGTGYGEEKLGVK